MESKGNDGEKDEIISLLIAKNKELNFENLKMKKEIKELTFELQTIKTQRVASTENNLIERFHEASIPPVEPEILNLEPSPVCSIPETENKLKFIPTTKIVPFVGTETINGSLLELPKTTNKPVGFKSKLRPPKDINLRKIDSSDSKVSKRESQLPTSKLSKFMKNNPQVSYFFISWTIFHRIGLIIE